MYATRFADGPCFRPASLSAALAINGGLIAALLLANPDVVKRVIPDPLKIIQIDLPKPPPEPEVQKRTTQPQPRPSTPVTNPIRELDLPPAPDTPVIGQPATGDPFGAGTGPGTIEKPTDPPASPPLVAARQDLRYLADFQPAYPDYERDAGRQGVVELRIRIGIDGRVKQVERLAGRDSFARVAIAHALAKWRFMPATRGGVPEESWKNMVVRFTLND